MSLTPEEQKLFNALNVTLSNLSRNLGNSGRSSNSPQASSSANAPRAKTKLERVAEDYERSFKFGNKTLSALTKQQQELVDITKEMAALSKRELKESTKGIALLAKYNSAIADSSELLNARLDEYSKLLGKTVSQQVDALTHNIKGDTSLRAASSKVIRNQSLLGASLLDSRESLRDGTRAHSAFLSGLTDAAKDFKNLQTDKLGEKFLRFSGVFDEVTNSVKDNLDVKDFAKFRLSLGMASETISESMSAINKEFSVENIQAMLEKSLQIDSRKGANGGKTDSADLGAEAEYRAALNDMILKLSKQGHDLGLGFDVADDNAETLAETLKNLNAKPLTELARKVNGLSIATTSTNKAFDKLAVSANTAAGKVELWWRSMKAPTLAGVGKNLAGSALTSLAGKLAAPGAAAGGFAQAKAGVGKAYNEMSSFNIAQIPATFTSVAKSAISMGMSFEDTVAFMQENKGMLAKYGKEDFDKLTSQFGKTFQTFGYTAKQSAELIGPSIANAISSGVDVSNGSKLNSYIDESMKSFAKVSSVVGITAKEYLQMNEELYKNDDVREKLMGMDSAQADAYRKSLTAERDRLMTTNNLTKAQAQQLTLTQESLKNNTVSTRVSEAAKMQQYASLIGMNSQDTNRAVLIHNQGAAATQEDSEWLNKTYAAEFAKRDAASKSQYAGTGMAGLSAQQTLDVTREKIGADQTGLGKMLMGDSSKQLAQNTASNANRTNAQVAAAGSAAPGSPGLANVGNAVNSATAIINTSFISALIGASTGLLGLMATSTMLNLSMKTGPISKMMGMFGGKGAAAAIGAAGAATTGGIVAGAGGVAAAGAATAGGAAAAGGLAGKLGLKTVLKALPFAGLAIGIGQGIMKGMDGDYLGAAGSLAAGGASMIPGVGTATAVAIEAALIARDAGMIGDKDGTKAAAAAAMDAQASLNAGSGSMGAQPNQINATNVDQIMQVQRKVAASQPVLDADTNNVNIMGDATGSNQTNSNSTKKALVANVSDITAQEQLVLITTALNDAVAILQTIKDDGLKTVGKDSLLSKSLFIPTALAFSTGTN
jgi:hypothetical protein